MEVAQISNLSVSLEIVSLRDDFAGGWHLAKRMECVELAPALVRRGWSKSASKLDALHTLRAIWLRPCRAVLYRRFPIGRPPDTPGTQEDSRGSHAETCRRRLPQPLCQSP